SNRTRSTYSSTLSLHDALPILTPNGESFSLVKAHPLTGRTHQIRVHLASLGHPIVGDKIYGPDGDLYLGFIETGWTDELARRLRSEEHTSELQSRFDIVCRLLL